MHVDQLQSLALLHSLAVHVQSTIDEITLHFKARAGLSPRDRPHAATLKLTELVPDDRNPDYFPTERGIALNTRIDALRDEAERFANHVEQLITED